MTDNWHFPRSQPSSGLWPQMLARENALAAWDKVRRNNGAPGVDGIAIRDLAPCIEQEWAAVDVSLRRGTWQPKPVRRVSVPKPNGGFRHLGIPTVMDRVVHQAVTQVVTPLWEKRFSPHSFAYRRGLGAREALTDLVDQAHAHGSINAWHLDIREFFDSVPHSQALRALRRVADEAEPLRVVQSILMAGAFTGARISPTTTGIPQGSPLSPLLANGVLHNLDIWLTDHSLPFVRYADDIVILLPIGQPQAYWQQEVSHRLSLLGLELNPAKATQGPLTALNFLGFSFFQDRHKSWRRRISPSSWEALEEQLKRRNTASFTLLGEDAGTAEDYFNGWLTHYRITECEHDQERLTKLTDAHQRSAFASPSIRLRVPYDGSSTANNTASNRTTRQGASSESWRQLLHLWAARAFARHWVRIGMDWGRTRNGFPLKGIRVSLGPFNFRFRL